MRGGGRTRHAERVANIPEWANSDAEVRKLLLKVFPKLETDENQRKRAAAWTLIIYFYFRMGMTQNEIAIRTGWTSKKVNSLIQSIRYAISGRTVNGDLRTGKRGRPKKNSQVLPATNGTFGGDSHISL